MKKQTRVWDKPYCEQCLLEQAQHQKEFEKKGGSNKPPIKIGTSDNLQGTID